MALIMALLITLVFGSIVAGAALGAGIERRTASAYATSTTLRHMAAGATVVVAADLETRDWSAVLSGAEPAWWQAPLSAQVDADALTDELGHETVAASSHGADTPVWVRWAAAPWRSADPAGPPGDVLVWVADDWADGDSHPQADTNGQLLVRGVAVRGTVKAWYEALYRRGIDGRLRPVHARAW